MQRGSRRSRPARLLLEKPQAFGERPCPQTVFLSPSLSFRAPLPLPASLVFEQSIQGELSSCSIQIAAFDKGRMGPHMLIGTIDLDLEGIYQLPGHELWRTWLSLTDPKLKRDGIQGQVLCCVTVLSMDDKPADHTQDVARTHPLPPSLTTALTVHAFLFASSFFSTVFFTSPGPSSRIFRCHPHFPLPQHLPPSRCQSWVFRP